MPSRAIASIGRPAISPHTPIGRSAASAALRSSASAARNAGDSGFVAGRQLRIAPVGSVEVLHEVVRAHRQEIRPRQGSPATATSGPGPRPSARPRPGSAGPARRRRPSASVAARSSSRSSRPRARFELPDIRRSSGTSPTAAVRPPPGSRRAAASGASRAGRARSGSPASRGRGLSCSTSSK